MVYKFTDIGKVSQEWDVKELGYFLDYVQPSNYISENIEDLKSNTNCIPVLTAGKSFILGYTTNNEKTFTKLPVILFDDFTTDTKYVDFPFQIRSSAVKILIAKKDVEFNFKFIFNSMQQINFISSDHKRYWISEYQLLTIPYPPLSEQNKIAQILSTWDAAIDNCKAIINQLQQRNKGLAQQLLTGSFNKKKLSEIFERITTKNTEGNQNVITISAQRGFIRQTDFFNKVVASEILDNYFLVKKGDFCYNKSYSNGYDWGAVKRLNDFDKAVVTTLYICFRLKDESKNSGDFFEYYFESGVLNKGLSKVANEGGRAHGLLNVTPTDFFNIKIGIPSFDEQIKIAKILSTATAELNQYQQKLQSLQQQKKGLMQQLLTGKIRVKTDNK